MSTVTGRLPKPTPPQKKGWKSQVTQLPANVDAPVPELPDTRDDWHPEAVRLWREIWSSPMASQYTDADAAGIRLLVDLEHRYWHATGTRDAAALAAEIRLQRRDFGLTPLDRNRLRWSIENADEAEHRGRQRRARTIEPAGGDDDPRNFLYSS